MAKIIPYHGLTMEGPKVPSEARGARSAGAPTGVGSGEGRRSPCPVWGSGGYAPGKFFKKSTLKLHFFKHFCKLKIKWSHLQCRQGTYD